jgi:hypothetical protein
MHIQYMGWMLENNGDKSPLIGEVYVKIIVNRILKMKVVNGLHPQRI